VDVQLDSTREGYAVEATVVVFEEQALPDQEIAEMEQSLSAEVDAPVTIEAVVLLGRRTD
jgi:hypothetical protein